MRRITLPPKAVTMISSMRSLGYTFETALADIIDNSVAARASNIHILIEENQNLPPFLAVVDDGCGMSREELNAAMQYACTNPQEKRSEHDLGRFGLGMKAASQSQCRTLTVLSKKHGEMSAAEWDLNLVAETDDWTLRLYAPSELVSIPCYDRLLLLEHGTVVVWRDFDQLKAKEFDVYDALINNLDQSREHLELIFHRYLSEGLLRMDINGRKLSPKDPFLINKSGTTPSERITIPGYEGFVRVIGYTLPHQNRLTHDELLSLGIKDRNMEDEQGFYIYRNKRLIFWGSWLRMTRKAMKTKLSRVQVDVPNTMDHLWELDIRKSQAYPPKLVRERLSRLLDSLCKTSAEVIGNRGRVSVGSKSSEESFWLPKDLGNHRYSVTINREASIISSFCDSLSDNQQKSFLSLLKWLEVSYPTRWVNEKFANDDSPEIVDTPSDEEMKHLKVSLRYLLQQLPTPGDMNRVLSIFSKFSPIPFNRRLGEALVESVLQEMAEEQKQLVK